MTEFYIPPKEISFRLLGYLSEYVLFSRTASKPEVSHTPNGTNYADQLFQLVPGTGDHAGHYIVKSKYTDKVLFSRTAKEPHVSHTDGNGTYADNWFRLEEGKGKYVKNFRLRNEFSNTVIYSRIHDEPQVSNISADKIYPDHYFSFLFEEMEVEKIEYHLDLGKIISSTPLVIANQTLENKAATEQDVAFDVKEKVAQSSTFEYAAGFTIAIGFALSGGVPGVVEAGFALDTSVSQEWKYGTTNEYSKSYTAHVPATAAPGATARAISSVNRGDIEVPFTIYLKSKSTGFNVETKGTYRWLTTWDLRHSVSHK